VVFITDDSGYVSLDDNPNSSCNNIMSLSHGLYGRYFYRYNAAGCPFIEGLFTDGARFINAYKITNDTLTFTMDSSAVFSDPIPYDNIPLCFEDTTEYYLRDSTGSFDRMIFRRVE
jgi:hypothetical protein